LLPATVHISRELAQSGRCFTLYSQTFVGRRQEDSALLQTFTPVLEYKLDFSWNNFHLLSLLSGRAASSVPALTVTFFSRL
jgi:hypothetical protein